jgi:hypothetical protein
MNPRKNPTKTEDFLDCCKEVGLSIIAIYTSTPLIKESASWNKDNWIRFCIFGNDVRYDRWPAIWYATKEFQKTHPEIRQSCGNSNQVQVNPGILRKGVYLLKNGIWIKEKE